MSWDNHGKFWHIDHITPCKSFDLTDPIQQKICFNYMNLQPLWNYENLQKNIKLDWVRSENPIPPWELVSCVRS